MSDTSSDSISYNQLELPVSRAYPSERDASSTRKLITLERENDRATIETWETTKDTPITHAATTIHTSGAGYTTSACRYYIQDIDI